MDPEKVANLLQIPLYFDLDIYTSGRQEKVKKKKLTSLKSVLSLKMIHISILIFTKAMTKIMSLLNIFFFKLLVHIQFILI